MLYRVKQLAGSNLNILTLVYAPIMYCSFSTSWPLRSRPASSVYILPSYEISRAHRHSHIPLSPSEELAQDCSRNAITYHELPANESVFTTKLHHYPCDRSRNRKDTVLFLMVHSPFGYTRKLGCVMRLRWNLQYKIVGSFRCVTGYDRYRSLGCPSAIPFISLWTYTRSQCRVEDIMIENENVVR